MALEMKDTAIAGVRGNLFRHPLSGPMLSGFGGAQTLYENWVRSVGLHGDKPFVGYRPVDRKGVAGPYKWTTYSEIDQLGTQFAAGLVALGLCPTLEDFKGGLLGFYAKNRPEWSIAEVACNRQGIAPVPLYDTLGVESVGFVIEQTQMAAVLCTSGVAKNMLAAAGQAAGKSSLRAIVLMDVHEQSADACAKVRQQAEDLTGPSSSSGAVPVKVYAWNEIYAAGKANPCKPTPPQARDVAFFCYTSGTTGSPKGALITHANMMSNLGSVIGSGVEVMREDGSTVHLSYLPLPHVFERLNHLLVIGHGGRIGYYQGDPLKILDDLTALRPTFFPSVPRLLSRIYDKIIGGVKEAGGMKAKLFNTALDAKIANLRTDSEGEGQLTHALWDRLVFNPLKKRLGLDRVEVMLTGSAPLAPRVMDFLRAVFGCPVMEGYGQTESAAAGTLTMPEDFTTGHVGVPSPSNEIALFDVPEMGYLSTDTVHKADGSPCRGRGEICFRGVNVFKSYYKMDDKTKETIDDEGWLHSGDIGVWTAEGKLRIVDRKKNIFKLSQGEYVAAEKIENIYAGSPLIQQTFVYGDSLQDKLVAVVVPDEEALRLWASKSANGVAKGGKGATFKQLCADPVVHTAIKKDMDKMGKEAQLKGFEFAKAIHLECVPFSVDTGLMTPTFKLKRAPARDYYRADIDKMYAQLNAGAGAARAAISSKL